MTIVSFLIASRFINRNLMEILLVEKENDGRKGNILNVRRSERKLSRENIINGTSRLIYHGTSLGNDRLGNQPSFYLRVKEN